MIGGVILDMDGTLLDTEKLSIKAWNYAGKKMGVGEAGFMVPRVIGLSEEKSNIILREQFGEDFDVKKFRKIKRDYATRQIRLHRPELKPGAAEALEYMRKNGIPYAIATSTALPLAKQRLRRARLLKHCPFIVGGDMVTKGKPDPEIFERARDMLGVETEKCIVVEDSPAGALGAHRGGFRAVMVPDLVQPDDETRAFLWKLLPSLEALPDVIGGENEK